MSSDPIPAPQLPLLTRANCAVRLWAFKALVFVGLGALRMAKSKEMKAVAPTYTKRYDVRPMLENRVFLPGDWKAGTKLPLFIDIHGGGFALCDPQTDDTFCHHMANKHGFCVVSINYRKAPIVAFPELVYDAAEVAKAVLADPELPVEHDKVAGGGFSAGGNLILAISQIEGLRGKFRALIPVYPVVDFSGVNKGAFKTMPDGTPDMLQNSSAWFNWGYISPGTDRSNPLMSPIYAPKDHLPERLFFVGAEYDVLCHEANVMAKNLAGNGSDGAVNDDYDWSKNGIKWRMVRDVQHGFTHVVLSGEKEVKRKETCDQLYAEMASWLKDEAFT